MLFGTKRICTLVMITLLVATMLTGCLKEPIVYNGTTGPVEIPTEPSVPANAEPTPPDNGEPQPTVYTLTFAGDCTLGTDPEVYNTPGTFVYVVGDKYEYPFEKAQDYFAKDDFTFVNLEGVLVEEGDGEDKDYRFRGPQAYAKILSAGSVEAVNLANNHTMDFGEEGYQSTKTALNRENIPYVEQNTSILYTTQSGLKIGIYAGQFWMDTAHMEAAVAKLREDGAEIVVVSYHGGTEGSYRVTPDQERYAHAAIDAGADIFFGHHPHVLQPIEEYNGGVIYYSVGNFAFGGNRNPKDKDTVVIQQQVIRELDGTVRLGETKAIPFCLSSDPSRNNYQPAPYEEDSEEYKRAMSKLDGTFDGPDLTVVNPSDTQPENTTPENTTPENTTPENTTPDNTQPDDTQQEPTPPDDTQQENTEPEQTT